MNSHITPQWTVYVIILIKQVKQYPQFNLFKPIGYVMHHQFNIQQLYALPTIYMICIYLGTNSDLWHLQPKLVGFYNGDEKCLQRGTTWAFN